MARRGIPRSTRVRSIAKGGKPGAGKRNVMQVPSGKSHRPSAMKTPPSGPMPWAGRAASPANLNAHSHG